MAKSRNRTVFLGLGAVVVAAVLGVMLYQLWMRVEALNARLGEEETREQQLEATAAEAGAELNAAKADFAAAQREATAALEESEAAQQRQGEAEQQALSVQEQAAQAEAERSRAEQQASAARQQYQRVRSARVRELDRMQEALSKIVETERTPLGMVMRLSEDSLQFDFDRAQIREQDKELLSRIAGVLLSSHGFRLSIYGHTDDQGAAGYNERLSLRRAQAVKNYFTRAGIDEDIISTHGLGESSPRVQGDSEWARQRNRRVEIGVIDTVIDYESLDDGASGVENP